MDWRTKTGVGAVFGVIGALGIVLGPSLGAADLGRPWSFLVGFVFGILAGLGVSLSVSGLLDRRRSV